MTITVKNNLDGTYTVNCGAESIMVGLPRTRRARAVNFPPLSSSDGGVVAHIINTVDPVARGKVLDLDAMLADMRTTAAEHAKGGLRRSARPPVLHYTLQGRHALDIGKIRLALGGPRGRSGLRARIFVGGRGD